MRREIFLYACRNQETANGCRRSARRGARGTLQVIPQRRFEANVQSDQQKRTARDRDDQAQKIAEQKETYDHTKAAPQRWIIWRCDLDGIKELPRPQARPKTKRKVVDSRQAEDEAIKLCAIVAGHRKAHSCHRAVANYQLFVEQPLLRARQLSWIRAVTWARRFLFFLHYLHHLSQRLHAHFACPCKGMVEDIY